MAATITSYVDSYFGALQFDLGAETSAEFTITDGTTSFKLHQVNSGFFLTGGPSGWARRAPNFKGGRGVYVNNPAVDGEKLEHTALDNVTETIPIGLHFNDAVEMESQINSLEKMLKVTAPRYWTSISHNQTPVYMKVKLPASEARYFLITEGRLVLPASVYDASYTWNTGKLWPIQLLLTHTPFSLKAIPGQVQGQVELASTYNWDYNVSWAVEDSSPTGQMYSMLKLSDDSAIYAGGASEIWKYSGGSWAAETTSPITLSENITAIAELANGDILFGGSGRIIKLSSGTYSEETTTPSAQVYSILELNNGEVLAGDDGTIYRRDTGGTWASDDTLPTGIVFDFLETTSGFVIAGGEGEILRTKEITETTALEIETVDRTDIAEERTVDGSVGLTTTDVDLFQGVNTWVGMMFRSVAIPAGATIVSCKIQMYANQNGGYRAANSVDIYGEASATPADYASTTNNLSNRTTTTAKVDWDAPELWSAGQWYYSPELQTIAQELVDDGSWASGNDMSFLFQDIVGELHRDVYCGTDLALNPILEISYQVSYAANDRWELKSSLPSGNAAALYDAGARIIVGDSGQFLSTADEGDTWGVLDSTPSTQVVSLGVGEEDGVIYAGGSGEILKSADYGVNWAVDDNSVPTGSVYGFSYLDSVMRAGDNGNILNKDSTANVTVGQERGTTEIFLANHRKQSNITHVKIDDGGVFTDIFPITSYDQDLFPSSAAVNDALYFGVDTSLANTSHFNSLVFDIATIAAATTSYTIVWEYYNGSTWATLNTLDETSQFSEAGIGVVAWDPPTDWSTTAIDSTTGYWVRARVSALTGTWTTPTQTNRDIYTVSLPYAQVASNEIDGTFNALLKANFRNRSDENGVGGSAPAMVQNRLVVGLKDVSGHENFTAFLNFADEQNPSGVSLDLTVDADSASATQDSSALDTATGREVFIDGTAVNAGAGLNNMADRACLRLTSTIASNYQGRYKVFLRARQNGGTAGDIQVRIKSVFGASGPTAYTDIVKTADTNIAGVLEFKQPITLPPVQSIISGEVPSEIRITVQTSHASASADLYLHDIVLIPVDSSWFDARDLANTTSSAIVKGTRVVVDSISIPRIDIRSLVQNQTSGTFLAPWQVDSNGVLSIEPDQQIRIWALALRSTSVSDAIWLSQYESVLSLKAWKTERESI